MGLDNGIVVTKINIDDVPKYLRSRIEIRDQYDRVEKDDGDVGFVKNGEKEYEFCYWRKCWGIRNGILGVVHAEMYGDKYDFKLEAREVRGVAEEVIIPFLDSDKWEEEGASIWSFDEIAEHLAWDVVMLLWLAAYMEEHPEVEVHFYDSY